jgi:hypothetical protein
MKQNEYFVFPSADFNPFEIDLLDSKNNRLISPNLFRVQKIATKNYFFRHHLETNVEDHKELKDIAISRLESIKKELTNFKLVKEKPILHGITLNQINGIINFIQAKDQSQLWPDCIEFNRRLDKTRNQSFEETTPEFKPYV